MTFIGREPGEKSDIVCLVGYVCKKKRFNIDMKICIYRYRARAMNMHMIFIDSETS